MKRSTPAPCPCGGAATYDACCGRFIDGPAPAPSAGLLMRSRYSAYVLERAEYLLSTWHTSTRPPDIRFDAPAPRWLGLDVRHEASLDADHASVEFVARLRIAGRAQRMHENSRFVREGGRWYYVSGDMIEQDCAAGRRA